MAPADTPRHGLGPFDPPAQGGSRLRVLMRRMARIDTEVPGQRALLPRLP